MITRRTRDIAGKVMAGSMLAFMLLLSVSVTREAFAATDPTKYTALTTIPGFTVANQVTNPIEKIKNLYGVAIGIAAVLAVVMIIYAGLEYSTAEAIYGKSGAKDKLLGAFSGLGLLLGSYLLLRTINVDLVNINLDLGAPVKGDIVASGAVANFQKQMLQNASAALTAVTAAETKVKTATAEKTALQTNLDKINSDLSKSQNAASPEARALVAEAEKIRLDIAATEQKLLNSKIEIVTGKIVQTENQSAEILIRKLESGKTEEAQSLFNTARITMEQHATKLKTDGATDTEIKIIDGKIAAVNLINEQY